MGKTLEYKNHNEFLKEAKKVSWEYLIFRNQSILLNSLMLRGYSTKEYYKKIFNIDYVWKNIVFINYNVFFEISDQKEIQNKFKKINQNQIIGFIKDCYKRGDKIIKYSERIRNMDLSKMPARKLFKLLENFKKELMIFSVYIIFPLYSHEKPFEEKIKIFLKKKKIKNIKNIISDLTYPKKKNFNYYEQIDFFDLAMKINNNKKLQIIITDCNVNEILEKIKNYPKIFNDIKNHIKKYGWIQCRNYYGNEWSLEEMFNRIKVVLPKAEKEKDGYLKLEQSMGKTYKTIIKRLEIKDEILKIIELSKEFTYLRTYRSDVFHISGFNIRNLLIEIGKRFGYNFYDMIHMRIEEIFNLPFKKIKRKDLEERKKGFAEIMVNTKMNLFWGEDLKKIKKDLDFSLNHKKENLIKGAIAHKGMASGKVKIVNIVEDLKKVNKGDILAAPMTFPSFIPAMEKASAFITDEGGILCHAAIVAREMRKPCIIGTKIATKVLKDGDLVEVDAERGVVIILKKANKFK